jgi:ligand-binding sensor domain-containing protein
MFVFCICKGQNKTELAPDTIKSETKEVISSHGPNTSVRTIKQDRKGNIWLASNEGIIRYDGKSFTNITGNLSSDRFFSVLEDRKGNFWFATYGSGVYYYDGKSFQHFTNKQGLANNQVSTIYEDKTGNMWFGANGGVSRFDGKSFRNFTTTGGLSINDVNSIIEDKTGKLWFGTRGNTYVYDGKTFTVFTYKGNSFTDVWSVTEDRKGNIWLGGNDGLWRYDGRTFTNFTGNSVAYVYEDKKGNIWTSGASDNGNGFGLTRYDEKTLSNKKPTATQINPEYADNKGMIWGILEANDGSIWFGNPDGVYRYDGHTITDFKDKVVQK